MMTTVLWATAVVVAAAGGAGVAWWFLRQDLARVPSAAPSDTSLSHDPDPEPDPDPDPGASQPHAAADELRLAVDELLAQNQQLLAQERATTSAELKRAVDEMIGQTRTALAGERVIGATELDARKSLIDQQMGAIATRLGEFERTVHALDGRNAQHLGQLASSVATLSQTTEHLRDALANSKARGQWGERMAEDVLRLAGFVEGINYHKQLAIASGTIPDFTFMMPGDVSLHMDVKFPLDNYIKCLDANNDLERERYRRTFLSDVRARVKELTVRGYLSDREGTVDCLLMFVPNEQVLGFVQEHDDALLDDALRERIVICSPLTLFAVLRVVRHSVDNFRLERTANEILTLLGQFEQQWNKFSDKLDKLNRSFGTAHRDLDELMTTRSRALQRPLDRIASLRNEANVDIPIDVPVDVPVDIPVDIPNAMTLVLEA